MKITVGSCIRLKNRSQKYWVEEIDGDAVTIGHYEGGRFPGSTVYFYKQTVSLSRMLARVEEILFSPVAALQGSCQ